MTQVFKKLVAELGETGAKAEMARRSAMRKDRRGFAIWDKDKHRKASIKGGWVTKKETGRKRWVKEEEQLDG